jgi:hypothetical protein
MDMIKSPFSKRSVAICIIITILFSSFYNFPSAISSTSATDKKLLEVIIRPQSEPRTMINIYKPNITPSDFSEAFRSITIAPTLNQLPALNKAITFTSLADIKQKIETVKNAGFRYVLFDIERSIDFGTPWNEIADGTTHNTINSQRVVNTFREASQIVRNAGLQFWSDAGYPFNRWDYQGFDYIKAFAPFVDGVKLQGMGYLEGNTGVQKYKDFIVESINRYKTANPKLTTFFAQVTTNPQLANLQKMKDATDAVLPYVTGMSSWYGNNLSELIQLKLWIIWYNAYKR